LLASPNPPGGNPSHKPASNDCQTDMQHATRGCCLSGYSSWASVLGMRDDEIETNYISDETERRKARDRFFGYLPRPRPRR